MERFNLIYADNGTGKTTLSEIIKSLAYNDPDRILTRKTILSNGPCEVSLQMDNKQCNFLNNSWKNLPDARFAIFDEEFIEKNIFSTNGINTDHKRQLFNYVVLGEKNVEKAHKLQDITNKELPELSRKISNLEDTLKKLTGIEDIKPLLKIKEMKYEDFIELKEKVSEKDTQIKNSENIKNHRPLETLNEIILPNYLPVLSQSLSEINNIEEYENYIKNHQEWLKQGLDIQKDDNQCPYCFQDIKDNAAIRAYKHFFSEQCHTLIDQIKKLSNEASNNLSQDKAILIEKTVRGNNENCTFWKLMNNSIPENIDFSNNYAEQVENYRVAINQLVDKKQRNILLPVEINENDRKKLEIDKKLSSEIKNYNSLIYEINKKISDIKFQHINIDSLKQDHENNLKILRFQEAAFYNDQTNKIFLEYKNCIEEKKCLTKQLVVLREEMSSESIELLNNYQHSINNLLKSFGVEFRIHKVERKADTARKETLTFTIELKGMAFDPNGSRKTPYSLTNTLSSGDRSTLAFALFLAKLKRTDLSNFILIFDDPITSLDFFRKQQTSKQISMISKKAKQVIVLTHSMEFAKLFCRIPVMDKYFKLFKSDSKAGVVLTPYNKLSDMYVAKHHDEHNMLTTYLESPESVDRIKVMKSIRSYVETKMRIYLPRLSALNPSNLGNFIKYLKEIKIDEDYIYNLELINDSIVDENHGSDSTSDDHENLTDSELQNLCRLALDLSAPPIKN